jgi:hypothetical protein
MAKKKKKKQTLDIFRTFKIRHYCPDRSWLAYFNELARKQSNAIRFANKRFKNGLDDNQVRAAISGLINYNIDNKGKKYIDPNTYQSMPTDAHFINSAVIYAEGIYKASIENGQDTLTFNQKAFDKYNKGEITKDQLKEERLFPIYSVGEANQKGNRKYNFLNHKKLEFKPNKKEHFIFYLNPSPNQEKYLLEIYRLANNKNAPITIMIDKKYIYLSFDIDHMNKNNRVCENKRVLGIDLNPNSLGLVIKDEEKIYKAEKIDFSDLRLYTRKGFASDSEEKIYLNNKKNHEVIESAYYVVDLAEKYKCEAISIEILDNMVARTKSRTFNRSVNNDFKRKLFKETIQKICIERNIKHLEIIASYTSFFGHVKYNHILGDPCSAAACVADAGIIELDRVANGEKRIAWFNKVKIDKSLYSNNAYLNQWKETDMNFSSIKDLYESIKKFLSKGNMYLSYHISYQASSIAWFKSRRSSVRCLSYISD